MIIIFILFSVLFVSSLVSIGLGFQNDEDSPVIQGLLALIVSVVGIYFIVKCIGEPQAIDVYRGNTTLEITYKDSIPIDSVVVFK